jgi:hypothetical protein
MSLSINSAKDAFDNLFETENPRSSQKKKQIITMREGKYDCTYIVDDKGRKSLLNKVPVNEDKKQKETGALPVAVSRSLSRIEAIHAENIQDVMNLLKEYAGIQPETGKTYTYRKV